LITSGKFTNEFFIGKALEEAEAALKENEIPIGAVIVVDDQIIGRGHNSIERLQDVTAHAEILAITAACNYLGSKYLENCRIYITLEPCAMCAAAIATVHIKRIIYGAKDPKKGYSLYIPSLLNPKSKVTKEILEEECSSLLKNFLSPKRRR
jgi:tRNA(adenine34) deaminase